MRKDFLPIAEFLREPTLRCVERLRVRDAYKGAQVEAFALKWLERPDAAEEFVILDISSLFASVCLKHPFPCGKPR